MKQLYVCNSKWPNLLSKGLLNRPLLILYSLSKNDISSKGVEPLTEGIEKLKALQQLR